MKDEELYALYLRENDSKLLGLLLERYTILLFGVCMKYLRNQEDAKDAVQTVFEKAIKEAAKSKIENFGGWIYKIAINECLMRLRKNSHTKTELTDNYEELSHEDLFLENEEKENQLTFIEKSLQLLPAEQKDCLERFYLQKQSYEKIAGLTGYSLKQVKSYIQNGRRNMRLLYLKQMNHD